MAKKFCPEKDAETMGGLIEKRNRQTCHTLHEIAGEQVTGAKKRPPNFNDASLKTSGGREDRTVKPLADCADVLFPLAALHHLRSAFPLLLPFFNPASAYKRPPPSRLALS
jgi:hypothetical protein